MAGILQFALGLNTSQFSAAAKQADEWVDRLARGTRGTVFGDFTERFSTALKAAKEIVGNVASTGEGGFLKMAASVASGTEAVALFNSVLRTTEEVARSVVENLVEAGQKAAELYYLSKRTNVPIDSLYGLREGAAAVGVDPGAITQLTLKLQRSLSGVSEEGERTDATFAALGLNMRDLRTQSPEDQFMNVAKALKEVNSAAKAGFAANLFGRANYGDILQITNQLEDFKRVLGENGANADLFSQTGKAFASARMEWIGLKGDIEVFFLGIAKYLVLPFQDVIEALRGIPWRSIGETIGMAFKPLADFINLQAHMAAFAGWWVDGNITTKAGRKEAGEWIDAHERQPNEGWTDYIARLLRIPTAEKNQNNPNGDSLPLNYQSSRVSQFEKMGFLMNGLSYDSSDYARRTAAATEKIAAHMDAARQSTPHAAGVAAGHGMIDILNAP